MTRHGLHPTAAAHHAFWATERRAPAPGLCNTPGQTAGMTAFDHGFDRPEITLIRQFQELPLRQRYLARTAPKPFSP